MRKLVIVDGSEHWLYSKLMILSNTSLAVFAPNQLFINDNHDFFSFSKATNALGLEWDYVLFDGRKSFNLEAFAIACGTIKDGGKLFLWVEDWLNYPHQIDEDSQRWADGKIQESKNFRQFLHKLSLKFAWELITEPNNIPPLTALSNTVISDDAIAEQNNLLHRLLSSKVNNIILTAPRGRGKSALAGRWLKATHQQKIPEVIVTAPNRKALSTLEKFAQYKLKFFSPDELLKKCQNGEIKSNRLIVDEAAAIPLPLLHKLITFFPYKFLLTTTENYEGTGQGFALKFMANAHLWHSFTLKHPWRWQSNDPLENFLNQLMLNKNPYLSPPNSEKIFPNSPQLNHYTATNFMPEECFIDFYQLLRLAHYRTTPLDLRRLWDGKEQDFFIYSQSSQLLGGVWTVKEGGLKKEKENLIQAIQRGQRRPSGNLVAQLLNQAYLFPSACQLNSARISRIAITPSLQNSGWGQKLCQAVITKFQQSNELDFLSVSFGYDSALAHFWHKCGFSLVWVGEHANARSGNFSAIALLPLTTQGEIFCEQCRQLFIQNFPAVFELTQHPLRQEIFPPIAPPHHLSEFSSLDQRIIEDFAYYHRQFFMSLPSILKLYQQNKLPQHCAIWKYLNKLIIEKNYFSPTPQMIKVFRRELAQILPN